MKNYPKFIFFTDFDGTITLQDSNDLLTDELGFGQEKRRQGNKDVLEGRKTFRKSFKEMMDSVRLPYSKCMEFLVKNIELDPNFKDFFQWSLKENIPVIILSSGMKPIIKALLEAQVGPDAEKLSVIANDVRARRGMSIEDEGGWEIVFHDKSGFGHDKSKSIRPYADLPDERPQPTLFYAGDGVSDVSAARETDLLFAKEGKDLVTYCAKEDIPFIEFKDWSVIADKVKDIAAGKTTASETAKRGYESFKAKEASKR